MKYYVVDAFTDELFKGNPAGVCLMDEWPDDRVMQAVAFENNLPETAFLIRRDGFYDLRWFTPEVEIDLCGHATLASAFVVANFCEPASEITEFHTKSGILAVRRAGGLYLMDFPARRPLPVPRPRGLSKALGAEPAGTYAARDLLILLKDEAAVRCLKPDFEKLKKLDGYFGVIVTAKGEKGDFVSRFFAPRAGIPEDPVTGSSHCELIPFWAERLNKTEMTAAQLSKRGGTLYCEYKGERVVIGGRAALYLKGEINL